MKVGSLFTGIGGLDLGLERADMTVAWQSEIDPYCCRVLAKHWPNVPNLGDITTIDWSDVEPVDIICGGYPCQPFSLAGVRRGEDDPRHLWPYFADAIRVLRPRFALLENVPGHLSLGFGRVLGDLAELGYNADWDCIPAAAVGAPHLRYRVFVVAHANGDGHGGTQDARRVGRMDDSDAETPRQRERSRTVVVDRGAPLADANASGWNGRTRQLGALGRSEPEDGGNAVPNANGEPMGRPAIAWGECGQWATEPDVGRVADGVPARVDRLRALGNAVVPQVAEWVGRQIMSIDSDELTAEDRVLVGVADVAADDVDEGVVQILNDGGPFRIAVNGQSDRVPHGAHYDQPAQKVNP